MTKNGKLVTDYLDYHAETLRLMREGTIESAEAACARAEAGDGIELWQACLDDGWTNEELMTAFERRFGKQ